MKRGACSAASVRDLPGPLPELADLRASRPPAPALSPAIAAGALLAIAAGLAMIFAVTRPGADRADGGFARTAIGEFPERSGAASSPRDSSERLLRRAGADLHIKLAEGPAGFGPFVICEVRDPSGLTIPSKGSRIRVYGQRPLRRPARPGLA